MMVSKREGFIQHTDRLSVSIILLACLLMFVVYGILAAVRVDFNQTEGELLFLSHQFVKEGHWKVLYPEIGQFPLLITNYPPVYMVLCSWFIHGGGPDLFPMRMVSLFSTIGVFCIIFALGKGKDKRIFPGIISAALLLVFYRSQWFYMARVDLLEVFFVMLSVYFIIERPVQKSYFLSFLLVVLAFFTKQTAGIIFVSFCILLGLRKAYRCLFLYGLLTVFTIILGVVGLQILTEGSFVRHVFLENASHGIEWKRVSRIMDFFQAHLWLIVVSGASFYFNRKESRYRELFILLVVTFIGAALSVLKPGGLQNHFILPYIFLILLSGGIFRWVGERTTGRILGTLFVLFLLGIHIKGKVNQYPGARAQKQVYDRLLNYMRSEDKPGFVGRYNSLGVKSKGKFILDSFDYSQKLRKGNWSEGILVEACERKDFSIAGVHSKVARFERLVGCLQTHYVKFERQYLMSDIYLPPEKVDRFRSFVK